MRKQVLRAHEELADRMSIKYIRENEYYTVGLHCRTVCRHRQRIGPELGPVPTRHPILGDGIGGLRQIGADLRYDPSGLALV